MAVRSTTKKLELPSQIKSLDSEMDNKIRLLIFGDPGAGKTPLAATAPNALIWEADRGLASAIASGSTAKQWKISDYNDVTEAYEYMRHEGCSQFEWLIFDGITMFQERGLDMIMEDLHAAKPHRQIYAPDKGEFGQNMNRVSKLIRDIKDLPINLIITAHAEPIDRELPNGEIVTSMMPAIQGKGMARKICGYVGVVAHLQTKPSKKGDGDYPVLSTRRRDGWYGKDRYDAIGTMVRPTVPKIVAAIESKLDPTKVSTNTDKGE